MHEYWQKKRMGPLHVYSCAQLAASSSFNTPGQPGTPPQGGAQTPPQHPDVIAINARILALEQLLNTAEASRVEAERRIVELQGQVLVKMPTSLFPV